MISDFLKRFPEITHFCPRNRRPLVNFWNVTQALQKNQKETMATQAGKYRTKSIYKSSQYGYKINNISYQAILISFLHSSLW